MAEEVGGREGEKERRMIELTSGGGKGSGVDQKPEKAGCNWVCVRAR